MEFYKKIFRSPKIRSQIMAWLQFVPDEPIVKLQYRLKCGRKLDLVNPKRYTEKMQWYKLYYRDETMRRCADKHLVREYVEGKGLGHLLNELYAVFETPEQINLDILPDKFALKVSNGSGTNLFCRDKSSLNEECVKRQFRDFIAQSNAPVGREWVYSDGKPVIVAERLFEIPGHPDMDPRDYKIMCFNGKPAYIICVDGRYTENYCHVIYDTQWQKQDVTIVGSSSAMDYEKPDTLEEMLKIAEILSEDFPAARVDLYDIDGKVYFGEITYFPWSGYKCFVPDQFDYNLGDMFVLPEKNFG